jgi:thymidine phosphorylase
VGLSAVLPLGAAVAVGEPMAVVHAAGADAAEAAVRAVQAAMQINSTAPQWQPPVLETLG